MGMLLICIGIMVIAPIIAFIALALQLLVAGMRVSDIWERGRAERFGFAPSSDPPPKRMVMPEVGSYIRRFEQCSSSQCQTVFGELAELLSNPEIESKKEFFGQLTSNHYSLKNSIQTCSNKVGNVEMAETLILQLDLLVAN